MRVESTEIDGPRLIIPRRFEDERGFFSETYSRSRLAEHGINIHFVQDNHSCSVQQGVVRGLHFQRPPFAQDKLVRVLRGSIFDVAVDIRRNSPTYGRHIARTLSAADGRQLLIPIGFAHGFCTLEPRTEVFYKVSADYSPTHEEGLLWSDARLAIAWPVAPADAILSAKDRVNPPWADLKSPF